MWVGCFSAHFHRVGHQHPAADESRERGIVPPKDLPPSYRSPELKFHPDLPLRLTSLFLTPTIHFPNWKEYCLPNL